MAIINRDEWFVKEKPKMVAQSASLTFLIAKKKTKKYGDNIEDEAILKVQPPLALAHEVIAYGLAKLLDLQIPDTQILPKENIKGTQKIITQDGTLSFRIPSPHDTWFNFPLKIKEQPSKYIKNYEEFALLFVFDVLIGNPDRHDRNLLLLDLLTDKTLFYIIDHGHALLGINGQSWPADINKDARNYEGSFGEIYREIVSNKYELFESAMKRVKAISNTKIDEIVSSVPEKYLTEEQADLLKAGLKNRKNDIEKLLKDWYDEHRTKGGN